MKIVALVLAGGEGTRLYPLTADHAKPALPFANGYRIIDFVLSNLANSRINTVYVLAQYKPESLVSHVSRVWAPWFSRSGGAVKVLLPRANTLSGQFKGTADAVYQYLDLVQAHAPDAVAVFAADHIYRMDVRQMVSFHLACEAEATVAAASVPLRQASSFGVMTSAPDGRVLEFREKPLQPAAKPGDPQRAFASMGNYLFEPGVLERILHESRRRGDTDFGRDILPRIARETRLYAYDFAHNRVPGLEDFEERCYWRDVGTLSALAAAQQDALGQQPRFSLLNRRWPVRGEHDAALLAKLRHRQLEPLDTEPLGEVPLGELRQSPGWLAAGKERRSDERQLPS